MTIVLNGTTGITNDGGYTGDGISFADTTPANTLVTTTGGNVGVGTASPNSYGGYTTLAINNATNGGLLQFQANGVAAGIVYGNANQMTIGSQISGKPLTFEVSGSERMRIDSSGNLLVGATSNPDTKKLYVNGSVGFANAAGQSNSVNWVANKGLGTANSGGFGLSYTTVNYTPGSASSNIYWDGNTGYLTLSTSSKKYKRNITPVTNEQLDKALQLKPSYYQRLEYDYWEYGLIAEEVAEIGLNEFVTKVDDEISGLNYEKMVTLAFGLIQRQQAMIEELKAELDATKAEVALQATEIAALKAAA